MGTVSYTMYLVHMPLLAVFDSLMPGVDPILRGILVFITTVAVAHLSFVLMESPLGKLCRLRVPS